MNHFLSCHKLKIAFQASCSKQAYYMLYIFKFFKLQIKKKMLQCSDFTEILIVVGSLFC